MNPFELLQRHYDPTSELYTILVVHSVLVAERARKIAKDYLKRHPEASLDVEFITEAALLHDIGVQACHADQFPANGTEPYVRHGVIGRELLDAEGLPRHALVCERHVGVGITREEVLAHGYPIPERDYVPESLEEKIICVADKFFSKTPSKLWKRKKLLKIESGLLRHGPEVLDRWYRLRQEILGS